MSFSLGWSVTMAVLVLFPNMHILCRLCSRSPSNGLAWLPNALFTIALHSQPLPMVLDGSKQSGTVWETSTKFNDLSGPSKTHPHSFPFSPRLHKTSPNHHVREWSAFRSAMCDQGFRHTCWMRKQSHESLWPTLLKLKFGNIWLSRKCCGSCCKKFNSGFRFQFQFQIPELIWPQPWSI